MPFDPAHADILLALDLAGVVGYAYGSTHDPLPAVIGRWIMPFEGGEGARYAALENELAELIEEISPSHMILEATLPLQAMNNYAAAAQQFGMRAIARSEAYRAAVPVSEIDAATVRGEVIGQRYFSKDTAKREVIKACRQLGLDPPDHNAGDAALVWIWRRRRVHHIPPISGPLFRGGNP